MAHTPTYTVSVKGVAFDCGGRVLLLFTKCGKWELPGGRLELGETPEQCLVREISEESSWRAAIGPLLDVWVNPPTNGKNVLIVAYGCHVLTPHAEPVISDEHQGFGLFTPEQVKGLPMSEQSKRSVMAWNKRHEDDSDYSFKAHACLTIPKHGHSCAIHGSQLPT